MVEYDPQNALPKWRRNSRLLWVGVPMYSFMLTLSLTRFLNQPDWRLFGVAWYAMFQIYAPTFGSACVLVIIVREVLLRNTSLPAGLALCLIVLITSALSLYWSLPLLLQV